MWATEARLHTMSRSPCSTIGISLIDTTPTDTSLREGLGADTSPSISSTRIMPPDTSHLGQYLLLRQQWRSLTAGLGQYRGFTPALGKCCYFFDSRFGSN